MSRADRGWDADWLADQVNRAKGWPRVSADDTLFNAQVAIVTASIEAEQKQAQTAPGSTQRPLVSVFPLVNACRNYGLAEPIPEYRFHPLRKWRFDYAWPLHMVAIEIEGGIWTQGRHTRGKGALGDMAKYNAAALLGWRLLRYTPNQIAEAVRDLRIALAA